LSLFEGAEARSEAILSVRVKILARVFGRRRIPDFAGEESVASVIARFEGTDAYRERPAKEGIVGGWAGLMGFDRSWRGVWQSLFLVLFCEQV
jgi:hypothetical protein